MSNPIESFVELILGDDPDLMSATRVKPLNDVEALFFNMAMARVDPSFVETVKTLADRMTKEHSDAVTTLVRYFERLEKTSEN